MYVEYNAYATQITFGLTVYSSCETHSMHYDFRHTAFERTDREEIPSVGWESEYHRFVYQRIRNRLDLECKWRLAQDYVVSLNWDGARDVTSYRPFHCFIFDVLTIRRMLRSFLGIH